MPEIRINAKPCPKCSHRNVTGEARICERCGTVLTADRRLRLFVVGGLTLALVVAGGLVFSNAFGGSSKSFAAPSPEVEAYSPVKRESAKPKRKAAAESPARNTPSTNSTSVGNVPGKVSVGESLFTPTAPSAEYQNLVQDADLMLEDFPFRVHSGPLDNFENEDIDRLAEQLSQPVNKDKVIFIVSLSENVGSSFIAHNRAEFAKLVLSKKYKLPNPIQTFGFGPEQAGNIKDPRMEIWVK